MWFLLMLCSVFVWLLMIVKKPVCDFAVTYSNSVRGSGVYQSRDVTRTS